jgi:hypothetical protein
MKIQFGNIQIKVPYEKYMLQKFTGKENPFEAIFSKRNQDVHNDFFKKAQSSFTNYYKKWMEKLSEMNKSDG